MLANCCFSGYADIVEQCSIKHGWTLFLPQLSWRVDIEVNFREVDKHKSPSGLG
ncbi:hypothetical protein SPWS13_2351 [Shewanella putrefaciens]|nr:hypothetical protein SPWS13_2351 [Shewanella putrefaciens]